MRHSCNTRANRLVIFPSIYAIIHFIMTKIRVGKEKRKGKGKKGRKKTVTTENRTQDALPYRARTAPPLKPERSSKASLRFWYNHHAHALFVCVVYVATYILGGRNDNYAIW